MSKNGQPFERRARGAASLLALVAVSGSLCWQYTEPICNSAFVAGAANIAGRGRDASAVILGSERNPIKQRSLRLESRDGKSMPIYVTRAVVRSLVPVGKIAQELREASDVDLRAAIIAGKKSRMQRRFDKDLKKPLNDRRDVTAFYRMKVATSLLNVRRVEAEKTRKARKEKALNRQLNKTASKYTAKRSKWATFSPKTIAHVAKLPSMVESRSRRGIWTKNDTITAWRQFAAKPRSFFILNHSPRRSYGHRLYPNGPWYENNQGTLAHHDTRAEVIFAKKNKLARNKNLINSVPTTHLIKYKNYNPWHLDKKSPERIWIRTGVPIDEQVTSETRVARNTSAP